MSEMEPTLALRLVDEASPAVPVQRVGLDDGLRQQERREPVDLVAAQRPRRVHILEPLLGLLPRPVVQHAHRVEHGVQLALARDCGRRGAHLAHEPRAEIGALARPDDVKFTPTLPKTRSGKIMRRLLRDIAAGRVTSGDTTTLEDIGVLAKLREDEE